MDAGYLELRNRFLVDPSKVNEYLWLLMQRMVGGENGIRRLVSLYEKKSKEEKEKRLTGFYDEVLGRTFFMAIEGERS